MASCGNGLPGAAGRVLVRIGARLSRHAARPHVVLLPDAVDVDVGRARVERPAADLCVALGVDRKLHAGHRVGELEEVARDLRRDLDLAQRNAAADFRGPDLGQAVAADHDLAEGGRRLLASEVQRRGRGDGQGDDLLGAGPGADAIGAGREADEHVAAVGVHLGAPREAGVGIRRDDLAAARRLAAQGRVRRLRRGLMRQRTRQQDRADCRREAPVTPGHGLHRSASVHEISLGR